MTKAERLKTYGLTQNDWLDSPTVPYREEDQYERCIDDKQCKLHPPIYSASWQLTYSQIDIETGRDRVIGDTNIDQDYTSSSFLWIIPCVRHHHQPWIPVVTVTVEAVSSTPQRL